MPVDYTALVTAAEVKRAAFRTLGDLINTQIDAASGDLYDGVLEMIEDATGVVERFLDRELIIRRQLLLFHSGHLSLWENRIVTDWPTRQGYENADEDLLKVAWARQWPGVEVISVDTDVLKAPDMQLVSASGSHDVERLAFDPDSALITENPFEVNLFAGYRRADQGIGTPGSGDTWTIDLLLEAGPPAEFDLSALTVATTDIPLLPRDIRRAALRIAIFDIRQQMLGLLGLESSVKTVDRTVVDLQKTRQEFVEDELAQIFSHRYIPTGRTP